MRVSRFATGDNLPEVPGIVLRIKGAPRGPRVPKDPEEEALKRLNKGTGKRGRPKKNQHTSEQIAEEEAIAV